MTATRFGGAWVRVLVAGFVTISLGACDDSGSTSSAPSLSTTQKTSLRSTTTTSSASSTTSTTSTSTSPAGVPSTTFPVSPEPSAGPGQSDCGTRAAAVYAAVQGGELGPVPIASYTITDCRIAPSNAIWAAVTLQPNAGASVIQLTVALQRIGSTWTVSSYGPDHVGCDAPPPVPTELRLGC